MLFGGESFTDKIKRWAKSKLTDWLMGDSNTTSEKEQAVDYPSIRGAKNQSATGKVIPLVLGKTLHTPYYIGKPYVTIGGEDGKEQYYHVLYVLGYHDIKVRDISLGIYKIANNDGKTNGVLPSKNYDTSKTVKKDVESGEIALNYGTDAHYDPEKYGIKLELQQGENEVSLYDQKVVQSEYGVELIHPEGADRLEVYGFSAKHPQKVEVEIDFGGLIKYNSEGNKENASVSIGVQMSVDGGASWIPFATFTGGKALVSSEDSITEFTRQKNEKMRFVASRSFTYEEVNEVNGTFTYTEDGVVKHGIKNNILELRVHRITTDSTDSNCNDKVSLAYITTWCYDKKKSEQAEMLVKQTPMTEKYRNKTARLGFVIKAGDELSGQIDELNCILTSKARVWDGTSWSKETVATNNPASLSLLAMTGDFRGNNAYELDDSGDVVTSEKIDLLSLGQCYEDCDEQVDYGGVMSSKYACDGMLVKKTKTVDLVNQILSCCRGSLVMNGTKYGVLMDKPRETPVMCLNNQNVLSASSSKTFDELPDGFLVKYISALNDYQEDSLIAKPNDCTIPESELKLEPLELPFFTNPFRAKAMALYQLASRKLRPEVWNITTSIDGNLIEVGNLVKYQSDVISVGIGDGAEITGFVYDNEDLPTQILGIKTDGWFSVTDKNADYGVLITEADGLSDPVIVKRKLVVTSEGVFNTLTFNEPISLNESRLPSIGDIVTFGLYNLESADAICTSKKDNGDGTFAITLLPYQEGVYTADSGIIDDFDSKVTPPQYHGTITEQSTGVSLDQLNNAIKNVATGESASVPPDVSELKVVAYRDEILLSCVTTNGGLSDSAINYIYQIKKGDEDWEEIEITNGIYTFDRETDGYPEKEELDTWLFRVKGVNLYGKQSVNWKESIVTTNTYGTWNVTKPVVNTRISDRTITLMCSESSLSDSSRVVYGNVRYKIQIKKTGVDSSFYKPEVKKDPYPDYNSGAVTENNYKNGEGFVISDGVYVQTMPLSGQDSKSMIDTNYTFKIVAYNEKGEDSEEEIVQAVARCTSIRDIVYANEDEKKNYVDNLTALCSAFGFISEGGSKDDLAELLNYWTLNDDVVTGIDSSGNNIKRKGAFRVGGETQYILSRPVLDTNGQIVDYEIEFKVGNFKLSSTQTEFNTCLYVYDEANSNKRIRISSNGFEIQEKVNGKWSVLAKLNADNKGNLTLTNAPNSDANLPKMRTLVDLSSVIYHLEQSTLDTNGGNSARFTFTPDEEKPYVDSSLVNEQSYAFNGIIKKTSLTDESICLFNNSDKLRIGNTLVNLDTLEIDDTPNELNQILGTNAFRWEM